MQSQQPDLSLSPQDIERIAIEAFAKVRVRDANGLFGKKDKIGVSLFILKDSAESVDTGVRLTIQLFVYEEREGSNEPVVRDVKEQQVFCVPGDADDTRLPAYFEGVALSIQKRLDRGDEMDTLMPHDLFPRRFVFADPERVTGEQFSDFIVRSVGGATADASTVDVSDLTGTESIAENRALEDAIADDPDNFANHRVYADWLIEHGDPRGELITCSMPDASPIQRRRAGQILATNERYFAANFFADVFEQYLELSTKRGWFSELRLWTDYDFASERKDFVTQALAAVMKHPSSKMIEGITIGCFNFEGQNDYDTIYDILAQAGPRKSMRSLFFGDMTSEDQEVSWVEGGDLNKLDGLYPNLTSLKIRAGSMSLENGINYPKLKSLVIESGGMSKENVALIANHPFPELTHLELWLGSSSYGGNSSLEDVLPILTGEHLPKLDVLALRNCEFTDAICAELVKTEAPILKRITKLDLSKGMMTNAGVQDIVSKKKLFENLTSLDVSENYIETLETLSAELTRADGIPMTILSTFQKGGANEDYRYVSLSE